MRRPRLYPENEAHTRALPWSHEAEALLVFKSIDIEVRHSGMT